MDDTRRTFEDPCGTAAGESKRLLTVRQAAHVLSISRSKLYELITTGELATVHIGRSVRVPVAELDHFVARLSGHTAA